MKNRIDITFADLKKNKKKAFVAYITAGDPNLDTTLSIMHLFAQKGVDIIELGVPFSDPIGDGPVNQAAAQRAIHSGTTLAKIFQMVKNFRKTCNIPVVLFSYLNPIHEFGIDHFAQAAKNANIDAVLLVDGPFDMCSDLKQNLNREGIHTIYLAAPTTSIERLKEITCNTGGFLYYISSLGVTGIRQSFSQDIGPRLKKIQSLTDKPICVGFGISTPQDAQKMARFCNGVIVGSAFVKIIAEHQADIKTMLDKLDSFTHSMVAAVKAI